MKIFEDKHSVFAVGVWFVLNLLLVRQLLVFGTVIPFNDDWILLAELRPEAEFHAERLWWVHNEHRIPLAKLFWFATVGGFHDVRAGTFLTVALVAAAAWTCMWTARRLRGRAHFTDAFFPLVLMHGGQCENVLNSFQLAFSIPAVLFVLGLVLVATSDQRPGPWRIVALGAVGLSMPLTGGVGLPQAVSWIGWLMFVHWAGRRSAAASERRTGRIALAFAVMIVALTAWYFVEYRFLPGFKAPTPTLLAQTALQFMARGIGETAVIVRPIGSWVVIALFAWTLAVLGVCARESGTMRARALGITVVMVGMAGTAAAVAYGRALDGDGAGLLERYGLIAAPLWCAFSVAAALAWHRRWGRALGITLFALGAASFVPNFLAGEREGQARRLKSAALEADLAAGDSLESIAKAHWRDFYYSPEGFVWVLRDMEAARLGPFGNPARITRPDAPFDPLWSTPLQSLALEDVQVREADGKRVLLVRDAIPLEFALGARAARASGFLGIHPELLRAGLTPRVHFTVELERADATRAVLFQHTLDPRTAEGSSETVFDVQLDAEAAHGKLSLRITCEGEPQLLWAGYWRDVLVR